MSRKTVMVVGGGGREHALAWKLARSPQVGRVIVAPGNAGTQWPAADGLAPAENRPAESIEELLRLAYDERVNLTVVGPEGPLAAGIVNRFTEADLLAFGPTQAAAQIEASKAFAKAFMAEHQIPTAAFGTFTDREEAAAYIREAGRPVVVKASGLAAGKGVIVCDTAGEAVRAVDRIMETFGEEVVIEERLSGREASLLAFTDGTTVVPMPPARDHKPVYDGNKGPNTGGMGAFAPLLDMPAADVRALTNAVLLPTVEGLAARGTLYRGVLYAGLILTERGPRVLEFNCRFGDPETQVLLTLLASDLYPVLEACATGTLSPDLVQWRAGAAAVVVLTSQGYPGRYPKGLPITGLDAIAGRQDVRAFHAGTATDASGRVVTAGGRVLGITAHGVELSDALRRAYAAAEQVSFQGMHYRRDIGVNYVG